MVISRTENHAPYGEQLSKASQARVSARPPVGGELARILGCQIDERFGQIGVFAGADSEHQRTLAILRDIGMSHRAVDVDPLPGLKRQRRIKLGVHFNAALEHINEFLAPMADELAELFDAVGTDAADDRHHALIA